MCQYLLEKFDSCYGGNIGVPLSGLNKDKKICSVSERGCF
jgi:UDP-N-acetylmuramoylalanine--D-glutamate ligase